VAFGLANAAIAQPFPNKPVTIIVPLTAGSPVDVAARIVAQHLSATFGHRALVENRPGAGGTIGTKYVAGAEPDGHVLLLNAVNQVIAPAMYKNLAYDPIKDFTAIGSVARSPLVFVVPSSLPARTFEEFVALVKANPGKFNFGYGLGTSPHILGELFKLTVGINLVNIPYKGGAHAMKDMLTGHIHLNIGTPATLVPLVRAGKIRALVVTGDARYPDLPEVPTIVDEKGLPELNFTLWMGLLAPKGLPAELTNRLNAALNGALQSQRVKDGMATLGFLPTPGSPDVFQKFLQREMDAWGKAVVRTGVKVN
jgi:tripartite-type tricarboxylate transporter receptor subunit TctC